VKGLPGTPDIVFSSIRVAVFVDGDFWHGYHFENWQAKLPDFWREKIERNRRRDRRNALALRKVGWTVVRIWEHDVMRDVEYAARKVERWLIRRRDQR
jgi:DNA mismatch endonuclease (patch repair protein)